MNQPQEQGKEQGPPSTPRKRGIDWAPLVVIVVGVVLMLIAGHHQSLTLLGILLVVGGAVSFLARAGAFSRRR